MNSRQKLRKEVIKMKSLLSLILITLALSVTFSDIPNVARNQKRALVPPEEPVNKANIAAAEQAKYDDKHQIQINFDANSILEKLDWITQNEAAR